MVPRALRAGEVPSVVVTTPTSLTRVGTASGVVASVVTRYLRTGRDGPGGNDENTAEVGRWEWERCGLW
ncbi:hypothetical protein JCM9957A_46010 [Kineosporia succinea]